MHPNEIKLAFERGENITGLLRNEQATEQNSEEIIEIAYDMQTGSYVAALDDADFFKQKQAYAQAIGDVLSSLEMDRFNGRILEAGVGEGTTLSFVMDCCGQLFSEFHGFDISWSRIAKCREWLESKGHHEAVLSVASIFHAPYADDAFDVVYTSHSIEPNGGREEQLLGELYRITKQYLVLLEPGYEFADGEGQKRMERLGYVRGVKSKAVEMGMDVIQHQPFGISMNQANPTALTIIKKNSAGRDPTGASVMDAAGADAEKKLVNGILGSPSPMFACPKYGDPMFENADSFFSPLSLMAYPKILGVPCLRIGDGVMASKYTDYGPG